MANNHRILIVDDVLLMCHFLYESLSTLPDTTCQFATKLSVAESLVTNNEFSLAIIDLHLDDDNGLQLVKRIRAGQSASAHDIPILIYSGNTYKSIIDQCLAFHVNDFLAKPISPAILCERVSAKLAQSKAIKAPAFYAEIPLHVNQKKPSQRAQPGFTKADPSKTDNQVQPNTPIPNQSGSSADVIIAYPTNATTGYHQLDRRLRQYCSFVNELHRMLDKPSAAQHAANLVLEINRDLDTLSFIVKRLRQKHGDPDYWAIFEKKKKELAQIDYGSWYRTKKHSKQREALENQIKHGWMVFISRPIMVRQEKTDEA